MIGQSYSACALVNPSASVRTTRSNDSGVTGRGACILSSAQNPSISSGPGNVISSFVVVTVDPPRVTDPPMHGNCPRTVQTHQGP